jgi:hypothetical protein
MKLTRLAFASALILLGFMVSEAALARPFGHRGGVRLSLAVGVPFGWGYGYGYYAPPYYSPYYAPYYPPSVTYSPPTYIEQGVQQSAPAAAAPQASPASQNYWYYCAESQAYYPYVNQCPGGWQRVAPTPPSG